MTQLHGPRSGNLVRTRRGNDIPAGSRKLGLHPDHGLEHGREPPGRIPVGDGGYVSAAREVIHVDPRFTRTSAMATQQVGIRAGSDIAFLGGVANYILENERYFREYVVHYTNAPIDPPRRLPRHRGSRRALLRLGRRRTRVRPGELAVRGRRSAWRRRWPREGVHADQGARGRPWRTAAPE